MSVMRRIAMPNALSALLPLALLAACDKATHVIHRFSSEQIRVAPQLELRVEGFGTWTSLRTGDSVVFVSGSPYVIEVRVRGSVEEVHLTSLVITDTTSGDSVVIGRWDTDAVDWSDSARVFALRDGVDLPPGAKTIHGVIRVGALADTSSHSFSGVLRYDVRAERRSRVLERMRGI